MAKQYMKIPKGTPLYDFTYNLPDLLNQTSTPSSREMVVEYHEATWFGRNPLGPRMVTWAKQDKVAYEKDVILDVPAPVKKDPVSKGPSIRQRMVKGTKWKLTAPAVVIKPGNPVVEKDRNSTWTTYSPVTDYELLIGTEFEVTGKTTTSLDFSPNGNWCWFSGMWVPIRVAGSKDIIHVSFSELNKDPEQLGEADVIPEFVIIDKDTGEYYAGHDWYNARGKIQYGVKLTKAKKFKRLADVRVHALIQSGYYDGLPESWGSIPEWMTGPKAFDIPRTWEIVKYDKLTKQEIERIELINTFDRSWKLRALTVKFSSAVRAVYSDLDKKGKLSEYSAMMIFGHKRKEGRHWVDELTEEEKDEVNALLARFAGDAKICKTNTGFAVAVKDAMTTTMIRLAYAGTLDCVMIDFKTMEEIVNK